MQSICKNRTLQWISRQINLGNISLTHKLQRKEGQWSTQTKSELIDSLLREYPVNPVYAIKEDKLLSIIDGVQRISTVRDFLADKFALSKKLDPIVIVTNENGSQMETVVDIAGKKFSRLDEDIRDLLLSSELQIYELTGATEKDVREMFRRQNAGKPLNSTQLRVSKESDEMHAAICSVTAHPLFDKLLTKAQKKKDLDKDLVRETLMLIETTPENEYTSFKSKQINDFVEKYQQDIQYDKIDVLKQALTCLDESFEEIRINTSSVPMMLYAAYQTVKEGKSFDGLAGVIRAFISGYEENEEYKALCGAGTTSADKVKGRFDYWRGLYSQIA